MRHQFFFTWSHTNRAVQSKKMARGLKFRIWEVEGLYYPCSGNKGADQLRGYLEANLRLRVRICKKPVFSRRGSYAKGRFSHNYDISYGSSSRCMSFLWHFLFSYFTARGTVSTHNPPVIIIIPIV